MSTTHAKTAFSGTSFEQGENGRLSSSFRAARRFSTAGLHSERESLG
jgi:hypothetical protein